jgi:alkyl sulfatase BDS1-like metallo-beta-lactamase superfamily hydrolase
MLVTNFMVTPVIFNISGLRGGRIRNPMNMVDDSRWLEGKDAELLLDIDNLPLNGRATVKAAIERSADQVQQIHDQTIRLIAQGLNARQAAEAITISAGLCEGSELTGRSKAMSGPPGATSAAGSATMSTTSTRFPSAPRPPGL